MHKVRTNYSLSDTINSVKLIIGDHGYAQVDTNWCGSEVYTPFNMQNLGDMVEYAMCDCGYDPDEFFGWFISSGVASKFEKGNPKYITGMSGFELAEAVLKATNIALPGIAPSHPDFKGREYWAGWIFAYYQWQSGRRFEDIVADGLTLSTVFGMYIHHEADNSKFVESADAIIRRNKESRKSVRARQKQPIWAQLKSPI